MTRRVKMKKTAGKLKRRVMAVVLTIAMMLSNMTVYAAELPGADARPVTDADLSGDEAASEGDLLTGEMAYADVLAELKTETVEHTLDTGKLAKLVDTDNTTVAAGTVLGDGYFGIAGNVMQRLKDGNPTCLQIDSKGKGAIKFTVTGTADLEIGASSNGGSNTSYIVLSDASQDYANAHQPNKAAGGEVTTVPEDKNRSTVTGSDKQTFTWTGLEAGAYVIYANGTDSNYNGRGVQIHTLKITETVTERGSWDGVDVPAIQDISVDNGTVNVKVSADIGDNGGDKLDVEMYKGASASAAPVATQSTKTRGTTHILTFVPEDSGTYCFAAKLSRVNQTTVKTSALSAATQVTVPLSAPDNLRVTEQLAGDSVASVTLSWDAVKGATSYKAAVAEAGAAPGTAPVYRNDNIGKSNTSIVIAAQNAQLVRGKTYIFSLTAVRSGTGADGGDEEVTAAIPKKISSGATETRIYSFNPAAMEDVSYMTTAKNGGPAHGTLLGTDIYFSVGIYNGNGYVNNSGQYATVRQKEQAGIEFTVQGTADVVVEAASTGASNATPIALWKITPKGVGKAPDKLEVMAEQDGKAAVSGDKNPNTLTWKGLSEGTYSLVSPNVDPVRDLRVFSITVKETSDRGERVDMQLLPRPEVKSVTNNNGTLTVNVEKAPIGYDGADRLVVVMLDSEGNEVSNVRGASGTEGSTHTVSMKLGECGTGSYTIKAKLVRGAGSDREELAGDVTKLFHYRQQLADPASLYAENLGRTASGSGSVRLSWNGAMGAQYYVIKVIDKNGQERSLSTPDNSTVYAIDTGLTIGEKYTFKVYAASRLDNQEELSANAAVVENYQIIEGAGDPPFAKGEYVLRVSGDIGVFNESTRQDGEMQRVGTDKFFTMIYNSSSKAVKDNQTFADGKTENTGLCFNSSARTIGGSIKFAISGASRVTVYWKAGADGRELKLIDGEDNELKATNIGTVKDENYVSKLYLSEAGTYYLGNKGGNNYIYRVEVYNEYTGTERPEWRNVPAPEILEVKQTGGDISVKVKAKIGSEGINAEADKVVVTMYDEDGNVAGSARTVLEGTDPVLTITPASSGKYRFKAALSRDDETEEKYSEYPAQKDEFFAFSLPLKTPVLAKEDVKNKGAVDEAKQYGSAELSWGSVKEADRYIVKVKGKDTEYEKDYSVDVPAILIDEELLVGKTYHFTVCAQRDATGKFDDAGVCTEPETTKASASVSLKIEAEYNSKWDFVVYGIGTSLKESGFVAKDGTAASDTKDSAGKDIYSSGFTIMKPDGVTPNPEYGDNGKVAPKPEDLGEDDFLRLWTWNGKGKIVPGDTDGLAFYYTQINPNTTNFKLSANLHVNHWRIGNGQEGFGLLAADRIGENGNTEYHWTNSYTAVVSKVDYKWDTVNDRWSTTDGTGVTLRLGIGSTAKTGVTAENLPVFENDVTTATTKYYKTQTLPLDTSVHTGQYDNLIGNETLGSTKMAPNPIVDMKLSIELNATGYYVSYTPLTKNADGTFKEGETSTIKYYDRNALSMCEENTAYIGFFATRFADVTFSNMDLQTSRYDPEEQREMPPVQEVKLKASVSGASTANSEDYNIIYSANWKGTVTITDEAGAVLVQQKLAPRDGDLTEEGKITVPVKLHIGTNKFQATYTPDKDYDPYNGNPPTRLTSYDSKVDTVTVTWKKYGGEGDILYVSPKGKATGDGTKVNPLDIYTAVKYVQPGQTIYLIGGTYNLTSTIKIDRGINGTKDKKIYMLADPETCTKENGVRPVFDFNSQCPAMVIAGDWWYCQGFDVTRSGNQMKGLQVSGNNNVLDGLNIYKNGSTGLQISRLLSSDKFEDWPSNNLILNCTSVLNADAGYTDADGFAAKLTVGEGNVFDGCISAYNADDGWDLFAKVWTGPIGIVTIKNSVSFENGQVIRDKETHELVWFNESDNWEIVGAGSSDENTPEDDGDLRSWEIIDAGSGNGYKMGGSSITGYHTLINSVAFHNKAKGIDSNSCNDIQAYNSISYDNVSYNIAMYSNASTTDFAANGVISYRKTVGMDNEDRIGLKDKSTQSSIVKTQEDCVEKVFNNTNFFWNKLLHVSEPGSEFYKHYTTCTDENTGKGYKPSNTVADDWFVSLDYEKWEQDYCMDTPIRLLGRSADGTIDLHGFLELSDKGKAQMAAAGAKNPAGLGGGTVSKDANGFKEEGVIGEETSGNINTGGEKSETGKSEEGIDPDDFAQMPGNAEDVGIWCAIVDRDKLEYTGKALKPVVHVYSGNVRLKQGRDYTVTYKNSRNAYVGAYGDDYYKQYSGLYGKYAGVDFAALKGAYGGVAPDKRPTIIVKGKGNYKNDAGEVTQVYFDINPVSIADDGMNRVGVSDMALIAKNGSPLSVNPVVTFTTRKLSSAKDKDYSFKVYAVDDGGNRAQAPVSGNKVSAVGLYQVEITGRNNFAGITSVDLHVVDGKDANVLASGFKLKNKIPDQYREGYNAVAADKTIPIPVKLSTEGGNADLIVLDKNGKQLVEGVNYRLSYKNNIDIGTATVIVTGMTSTDEDGNKTVYVGSKEFKFRIVAPALNNMLKTQDAKLIDTTGLTCEKVNGMLKLASDAELKAFGDNRSYEYEGREVDPVNDDNLGLAVKRGGEWYLLVQGKDYKLTYKNNTRQGSASAVFTGIGNYRGSVTQKFKITPFDLDKPENRLPQEGESVSKIGGTFEIKAGDTNTGTVFKDGYNQSQRIYSGLEATYNKGGVRPVVSLKINGNRLVAGKDYTVTYRNNTKPTEAGTPANKLPAIIIKGKNGLKGTLTGTFTISRKDFNDKADVISVTAQDVKISKSTGEGYTGSYKTRLVVKDAKGKTLSAGTDYDKKVKYELVDNATHRIVIKELQDNEQVTIRKDDADQYLTVRATVYPKSDSKFYQGSDEGISTYYRVLYTKNSIRRSTFVVNYSAASDDDTCPYEPTADGKAFYYYENGINLNGSLLTVSLDGRKLVWGEDFEVVSYVGNKKQGTAKLTIQGKGKYCDTRVVTFKIVPKRFTWWQKLFK